MRNDCKEHAVRIIPRVGRKLHAARSSDYGWYERGLVQFSALGAQRASVQASTLTVGRPREKETQDSERSEHRKARYEHVGARSRAVPQKTVQQETKTVEEAFTQPAQPASSMRLGGAFRYQRFRVPTDICLRPSPWMKREKSGSGRTVRQSGQTPFTVDLLQHLRPLESWEVVQLRSV